jgi:hypothetical protein
MKLIEFAGQSIQNSNWLTRRIMYRQLPNKNVETRALSRRDGFRILSSSYESKEISISGVLVQSTEELLRTSINTMKEYLNRDEQLLKITDGSITLCYTATLVAFNVPEDYYHITTLPYEMTFRCQPLGFSQTASTESASITTSTSTYNYNPIGSGSPTPKIRWTITTTASSPITAITFINNTTGDTITVTGLTMSNDGQYLEVDVNAMTVVYNNGSTNSTLDFTGVFPRFVTYTNALSTAIVGGGSFGLKQKIEYYAKYL